MSENLDCMWPDDLEAFARDKSKPRKLRRYARYKARAMVLRASGAVCAAMALESVCESIYSALPKRLRW
jgi:hypothetical protein